MRRNRHDGSRAHEDGYALVAAVASIGVFAALSLAVATAARVSLASGAAEIASARAAAAADAGTALALHGLLADDPLATWPIDGRPERLAFDHATLVIRVEDERGKVPINRLNEALATRLLSAVGVDGARLAIARDSLLDWIDDDDEARPDGAEAGYYAPLGIEPRNGALLTIDELGRVRGFDAALVARIRRIATVNSGGVGFDPRFADPLAVATLEGDGADATQGIDRAREQAGERTALALHGDVDLVGRPLTIAVDAYVPGGGHAHREEIVELTGSAPRPYVVRSFN